MMKLEEIRETSRQDGKNLEQECIFSEKNEFLEVLIRFDTDSEKQQCEQQSQHDWEPKTNTLV